MSNLLFAILVTLLTGVLHGQTARKYFISSQDPGQLYLNDNRADSLFYYATLPAGEPKGLLALLPGYFQKAERIFLETQLAAVARAAGIATVIPSLNGRIYLDPDSRAFLDQVLGHVLSTHKIRKEKVVFGGFSAGGLLALSYAEAAHKTAGATLVVPRAVFGVDCPTDLTNMWRRITVTLERNCSPSLVGEAKFLRDLFTTQFLGPPEQYPDKYVAASAFSRHVKEGGNAKYLRTVPVRLYCEPDMDFWLKQMCADYYDTNAPDLSALVNQLRIAGNQKAEFIATSGKGFTAEGTRFPHSWSIVDAEECIRWLQLHLQ